MDEGYEGVVDSQEESVDQSGVEQEGQEAGGGSSGSSQSEARQEAQYLTREMYEQSLAGVSGQFNEAISNLRNELIGQMKAAIRQQQTETQRSKATEELKLETVDDLKNALKNLSNQNMSKLRSLEARLLMAEQERRDAVKSEQLYSVLEKQHASAIEKFPVFQNPKADQLLRKQVYFAAKDAGGDLSRVNISAIASDLASMLSSASGGRAKITNPNPVVSRTHGSPSRQVLNQKPAESTQEFQKQHEAILKQLAEEMGLE